MDRWEARVGTRSRVSTTETDITFESLSANTQYVAYVRGVNDVGNGTEAFVTFRTLPTPTTTPPGAPTLSVGNIRQTAVTLSWAAAAGTAVRQWQISVDGRSFQNISPQQDRATGRFSYDVTRLTHSTRYTRYIRGLAADGTRGRSASRSFTTASPPPVPVPDAPDVTAIATASNAITATWVPQGDAPVTNWQVRIGSGGWINKGRATAHSFFLLTPETEYTIGVRGQNASGFGAVGTDTATTLAAPAPPDPGDPQPTTPPSRPLTVTAANITQTSANINFTPGSGGGTVARWEVSSDGVRWTVITGGASARTTPATGLTADTAYTRYIRGVTSDGTAGPPRSVNFRTLARTTTARRNPLTPTSASIRALSDTELEISWVGGVRSDGTGSDVDEWQFRLGGTGNFEAGTAAPSARTFVISNLTPNTSYTICVRGRNSAGNGGARCATGRTQQTATVATTPVAPTLTRTNVTMTSATIGWSPGTGGAAVGPLGVSPRPGHCQLAAYRRRCGYPATQSHWFVTGQLLPILCAGRVR